MAEAAHRGFVRHRLAAEIDADKPARRLRIVDRLFNHRSDKLNHCCRKYSRNIRSTPIGGRPLPGLG